jgi:hypothetical protein
MSDNYVLFPVWKKFRYVSSLPFMFTDHKPILLFGENCVDLPSDSYKISSGADLDLSDFISETIRTTDLVTRINDVVKQQGTLLLNSFLPASGFDELFDIPGVKPFNLSVSEYGLLNSKTFQFSLLDGSVPLPNYKVASVENPSSFFDDVKSPLGVFTLLDNVPGGSGTKLHKDKQSVIDYFGDLDYDANFLMAEALNLVSSPCIDAIIANENEIIVYGLLDQVLDGSSSVGTRYPSSLSPAVIKQIYEITHIAARKLASIGIRGYVSFDHLVDASENVYFGEINPRYASSTNERMLMMDAVRAPGSPTVMDLTYLARHKNSFQGHTLPEEPSVHWYKHEFGLPLTAPEESVSVAINHLSRTEKALFENGVSGWTLIGQKPAGSQLERGHAAAKFVALANTENELNKLIDYERILHDQTFK